MRIGLVVDAGCDLPDEMIADENVVVLPIAVRIGEHMTLDTRNSDVTRQFMESDIAKDAAEAETIPYTVEQIRELIGCYALICQDVGAMKQAIGSLNPGLAGFDASCFDGVYVTGDITQETIARMNQGRDQTEEGQEDASRLALPNAQTA